MSLKEPKPLNVAMFYGIIHHANLCRYISVHKLMFEEPGSCTHSAPAFLFSFWANFLSNSYSLYIKIAMFLQKISSKYTGYKRTFNKSLL